MRRAIVGNNNVIPMHTHPCSMPPSIADFNSVEEHDYQLGIVLCHDGKIFCYRSSEKITKLMYDLYVVDYYKESHDEYMAQYEALKELYQWRRGELGNMGGGLRGLDRQILAW